MDLLATDDIQSNIKRIIESHKEFTSSLKGHENVSEIRQCGVILAIDLVKEIPRYGPERDAVYKFFMERGVYLRPLGNTIYIVPPFVIKQEELTKVYNAIREALVFFS